MVFQKILSEALQTIDGSLGAMFFDEQGEAVEIVSREFARYDMQVVGAYQGIYLDRIRRMCSGLDHGDPVRFKIDWINASQFNWVLKDGYYLVLIVEKRLDEGSIWNKMARIRDQLLEEF